MSATARRRVLHVAGAALAVAAAGLVVSGVASWGTAGDGSSPHAQHGMQHGTAADGSMIHGGVTYYAGPVPDVLPAELLASATPVEVTIPGIGVSAELDRLGIGPDGAVEVPRDFDRAGWFSGGGRPGLVGPTVLVGHVDSREGPAVFHRLRQLVGGAEVVVRTADGTLARYTVERTEEVTKAAFPTFEVFGAAQADVVRLVTCTGEFDRAAGSYENNLIVYAVRTDPARTGTVRTDGELRTNAPPTTAAELPAAVGQGQG